MKFKWENIENATSTWEVMIKTCYSFFLPPIMDCVKKEDAPLLCLPMPFTSPETIDFGLHSRREVISQPIWNLL